MLTIASGCASLDDPNDPPLVGSVAQSLERNDDGERFGLAPGVPSSGVFETVASWSTGEPEGAVTVPWWIEPGISPEVAQIERPVVERPAEPPRARVRDADVLLAGDSVVREPDGRVWASVHIVGASDALNEKAPWPRDAWKMSGDEKGRRIAEREAAIAAMIPAIAGPLERCGLDVLSTLWVDARLLTLVDRTSLACLFEDDRVEEVHVNAVLRTATTSGDGLEIRNATRAGIMDAAGFHGEGGSTRNPGQPVRVGVIDTEPINHLHPTWHDWQGGASRLLVTKTCTATSCTSGSPHSAGVSHGTAVAHAAIGSIQQGQDPAYPGTATADQHRRSGFAREAELAFYYLSVGGDHALARAITQASADKVDILVVSLIPNCDTGNAYGWCHPRNNCADLNTVLRAAVDAGTVVFWAAGNIEPSQQTPCTVGYPAYRPEVVSVNSLRFPTGSDYTNSVRETDRSYGSIPIKTRSGSNVSTPGIDIAAPDRVRYLPVGDSGGFVDENYPGTSIAAPHAAGHAVALRHAMATHAWGSASDARAFMNNFFLSGDASDGTANGATYTRVNEKIGYGRLRMHWFSPVSGKMDPSLGVPWMWGSNALVVTNGNQTVWDVGGPGPEPSSATQYRVSVMWDEPDLESVNDIGLSLWNTCPAGGGAPVLLHTDNSFGLRKRIVRNFGIGGRCLQARLHGYDVKPGGVTVYVADYYHSGTPELP